MYRSLQYAYEHDRKYRYQQVAGRIWARGSSRVCGNGLRRNQFNKWYALGSWRKVENGRLFVCALCWTQTKSCQKNQHASETVMHFFDKVPNGYPHATLSRFTSFYKTGAFRLSGNTAQHWLHYKKLAKSYFSTCCLRLPYTFCFSFHFMSTSSHICPLNSIAVIETARS